MVFSTAEKRQDSRSLTAVFHHHMCLPFNLSLIHICKDTIEAYAWAGTEVGGSYPYVETDDYGAVFHVGLKPEDGVTTAGFKIIENGDADAAAEYEADLTKATDQTLDVYVVEGNPTFWYEKSEACLLYTSRCV